MSPGICLVIPLPQARRSTKCGAKAVNLSRLVEAGFDVPPGFVICSDAYHWHLWTTGAVFPPADGVEAEDREAIRAAILGQRVAEDVWSAVSQAYRELGLKCGMEEPKVAVRSSALQDFPGAYESFLNVAGLDELKTAVKRVWASVWNGRAAAFRARLRPAGEPAMAVIVQRMVDREYCGSATTANPITGNPNRVLVACESNSGETDHFELDLSEPHPSSSTGGSGVDPMAALVAERAVLIEEILQSRVEVEWAHDGERLWILQAQPLEGIPPYFPVDPADDSGVERRRATRLPVSPFSRNLLWGAARRRSSPFAARRGKDERSLINGYAYVRAGGIDDADDEPDTPRAQAREITRGLKLLAQCRDEPAPALRSLSARIISLDLAGMPRPALLRELAAASDALRRAVELLDQSWYPSVRFPRLLRAFVGSGTDAECLYQRLISGAAEATIMRDAKLQDMGDRCAAARRSGRLDDGEWWRAFRRDVEAFAREYGCAFASSGEAYDAASWRSWVEDPEPLFRTIGALARRGKRASLVTRHSARAASAREAEEEADEMYDGGAGARFRKLTALSRGWLAARNEAEDLCALAGTALRLVLIELGRRLAESGVISCQEDIFCLRMEEILSLPETPSRAQTAGLAASVARRKHELWLEDRLAAPDRLPADRIPDRPIGGPIRGRSLSPGIATGRARVARTIAEAGEIENGEILIVESAGLAWTPFLGIAGGFVSEDDSPSIAPIALDYGIPALVGCAGATQAFRAGARITVDGSAGVVGLAGAPDPAAKSTAPTGQRSFSRKTRKTTG